MTAINHSAKEIADLYEQLSEFNKETLFNFLKKLLTSEKKNRAYNFARFF